MEISEQRNAAEVGSEYFRVKERVENEVRRRTSRSLHLTYFQVLGELVREILDGNYAAVRSPPHGSSQSPTPSIITVRRVLEDLRNEYLNQQMVENNCYSNRNKAPNSPFISPYRRLVINEESNRNFGNAVRNLGFEFLAPIPPDHGRDAGNRRSSRTAELYRGNMIRTCARGRRTRTIESSGTDENFSSLRKTAIRPYQYTPDTFRPLELTLKQAIEVMNTFDLELHITTIRTTLLSYSLRIYGVVVKDRRNLKSSVSSFIERYFNLQPVIELCVRNIHDYHDRNVVGVLFERSQAVNWILSNKKNLENTDFKVAKNFAYDWIIWNYDG